MMKHSLAAASAAALLALAAPAMAADSWGLQGEQEAMVEGTVVDVLCELTKDCPQACGAGKRQLGIKTADGKLLAAAKDAAAFAGAVHDLLPHCGKPVVADGLITERFGTRLYVVQAVKAKGAKEFTDADAFIAYWAKVTKNKPDGEEAEEWFRHSPTVKRTLAKGGKLGVPE